MIKITTRLAALLLAAPLAFNAQAGVISWNFTEDLEVNFAEKNINYFGDYQNAWFVLVDANKIESIVDGIQGGTFTTDMTGVLGIWNMYPPDMTPGQTYATLIDDSYIVENVYLFGLFEFSKDGVEYEYDYHKGDPPGPPSEDSTGYLFWLFSNLDGGLQGNYPYESSELEWVDDDGTVIFNTFSSIKDYYYWDTPIFNLPDPVPEPATGLLVGFGTAIVLLRRRRFRNA